MFKAFEYKLYPTKIQSAAMAEMLETHRRLYNFALEHRRTAYKMAGVSVTFYQQSAEMKFIRKEDPYVAKTNAASCEQTLRRLDRAFQSFFRRLKSGQKAGYPRFKSKGRFHSVEFRASHSKPGHFGSDGAKLASDGRHVYFQHIGNVKVKMHRPTEGDIKTLSFKKKADGWYLVAACDFGDPMVEPSWNPPVGIDLGISSFIATSDGATVPAPKPFHTARSKLRRVRRHEARCKRGSNRHRKAAQRVARLHQHIANIRRDFHHKTARALVATYGMIAVEGLSIKGLAKTLHSGQVHDAGWGQFVTILKHKAEGAGVKIVVVSPRNTSQVCSDCGSLVPKTLKVRVHRCPDCGFSADRDVNAARNILQLGLGSSLRAPTLPLGGVVREACSTEQE
jgi:putative transposase